MPAKIFNSVLFPLPLRPTMPKNSPFFISKSISCRACCVSLELRLPLAKLVNNPFTELTRSCGNTKSLETLLARMTISSELISILHFLRKIFRATTEVARRQNDDYERQAEWNCPYPTIAVIQTIDSVGL